MLDRKRRGGCGGQRRWPLGMCFDRLPWLFSGLFATKCFVMFQRKGGLVEQHSGSSQSGGITTRHLSQAPLNTGHKCQRNTNKTPPRCPTITARTLLAQAAPPKGCSHTPHDNQHTSLRARGSSSTYPAKQGAQKTQRPIWTSIVTKHVVLSEASTKDTLLRKCSRRRAKPCWVAHPRSLPRGSVLHRSRVCSACQTCRAERICDGVAPHSQSAPEPAVHHLQKLRPLLLPPAPHHREAQAPPCGGNGGQREAVEHSQPERRKKREPRKCATQVRSRERCAADTVLGFWTCDSPRSPVVIFTATHCDVIGFCKVCAPGPSFVSLRCSAHLRIGAPDRRGAQAQGRWEWPQQHRRHGPCGRATNPPPHLVGIFPALEAHKSSLERRPRGWGHRKPREPRRSSADAHFTSDGVRIRRRALML